MGELVVYTVLALIFTAVFFVVGAYLRCRRHWHAHLIHFHHAYIGLILLTGVSISRYMKSYPYFFVSVAVGLIVSDMIHHLFFKVPFCLNE